MSAINSNTLTITNGSSIVLGVGDNLYYNLDTKLINKIDMIDNSIVNSQISVTSNTDYITFSNSAIKPNLDVDDKVLINDNLLYKIKKVEKNKLICQQVLIL